MRSINVVAALLCLQALFACPLKADADEAPSLGAVEAIRIAVDGYIYGYPLVTFDIARRQQINAPMPRVTC
jgi:hypothetical protein